MSAQEQRAVQAAASFLRQHPVRFPGGRIPSRPGEIAVLAVKSYARVPGPRSGRRGGRAAGIVEACRAFDQRSRVNACRASTSRPIVIAFAAEFGADLIISALVFCLFAQAT